MAKSIYSIKTFADLSNRKQAKTSTHKRYGLILTIVFMCCLILYMQPGKKPRLATQKKVDVVSNSQNTLSQNLLYLHQQAHKMVPIIHHVAHKPVHDSKTVLAARHNAPMTMYHASQLARVKEIGFLQQKSGLAEFANRQSSTHAVRARSTGNIEYTVVSGELMHAVLESSIQSDLPGQIRALVSEPVYSYVGQRILIPKGSRLIGQYHTAEALSQQRVMVVWNRLILPNGISVQIDSGGVDDQGRSGQKADAVNRHFWQRFGQASLLSLIGAGAATASVSDSDQYNSLSQYRSSLAQAFQQSASQSLQHDMDSKPTLIINAGARINVFVARDINMIDVMPAVVGRGV